MLAVSVAFRVLLATSRFASSTSSELLRSFLRRLSAWQLLTRSLSSTTAHVACSSRRLLNFSLADATVSHVVTLHVVLSHGTFGGRWITILLSPAQTLIFKDTVTKIEIDYMSLQYCLLPPRRPLSNGVHRPTDQHAAECDSTPTAEEHWPLLLAFVVSGIILR